VLRHAADPLPDLTGRTALVTGANSGLGLAVSSGLAGAGALVVLGCRDRSRGEDAVAAVRSAARAGAPEPRLLVLDLASLDAVRSAAVRLPELLGDRVGLDLLVNNAGIMATPLGRTADGFEQQLGVNHLGHFTLTGLVLPLLLAGDAQPAPRVVTVSSGAHRMGRIDLDDLDWQQRRYRPWAAYGQSKLANLLFTRELARRAEAAGLPLLAVAAHPGYAATNLQYGPARRGVARAVVSVLNPLVGQSPEGGARPILHAATAPDVRNGDYYGPDGFLEQRGGPERVGRSEAAQDDATARALWARSEELTGVRYPAPLDAAA
jgi:protochlorophyllide reductase